MQGGDAGFGGRVVGELGGADVADDRGDGDDGAAAVGAGEGREEGVQGVEVREEVGGEGAVDFGEGEGEEGLAEDEGRVVD